MKLIELEPHFIKIINSNSWTTDSSPQDADGIQFLCPKCFSDNKGPMGTHMIICWKPHVPQTFYPVPGRWNIVGNSYDNLSLVAGSSSVLLTGGCKAHFFVRNGEIINC